MGDTSSGLTLLGVFGTSILVRPTQAWCPSAALGQLYSPVYDLCHRYPKIRFLHFDPSLAPENRSNRARICKLVHPRQMHMRCKFDDCRYRSVTCRDNARMGGSRRFSNWGWFSFRERFQIAVTSEYVADLGEFRLVSSEGIRRRKKESKKKESV